MVNVPDGPKIPRTLQLIYWIADPLNFLEKCAKRYGDFFSIRLGNFDPFVMVAHPQGVQEIFNRDAQFDEGRGNDIVQPLVGANSLLVLDGNRHRRDRKLLMPSFHGESIRAYSQIICEITEQVACQWGNKPFIARAAMQEITLEVILQAVFGIREGQRYQQLKPLLAAMLNMFDSPLRSSPLFFRFLQKDWGAWSPWGQFAQRQGQIRALLQAEIDERRDRSEGSGTDVLSLMMMARDEQGEPMTDEELQDEMLTLLIAGHETTATALAWAFYWIHKQPQILEKLLHELDGVGLEPTAIARLPYLNAVCQETLRIYPVVPVTFPRIAKSSVEIMGHQFAPDTVLFPCIYLIHHRPDLYPEPKQFKPERFIERQYSAYEFLPFGGGSRRCLGAALAMLEMKLVLATVLLRYQLTLTDNKPVKAVRRGLTIAPSGGIPLVVTGQRTQRAKAAVRSV